MTRLYHALLQKAYTHYVGCLLATLLISWGSVVTLKDDLRYAKDAKAQLASLTAEVDELEGAIGSLRQTWQAAQADHQEERARTDALQQFILKTNPDLLYRWQLTAQLEATNERLGQLGGRMEHFGSVLERILRTPE